MNKNKRVGHAIKNLISAFSLQFITVILNMITLRLFIEVYGSNMNGLVSSISQILGYAMLVEAGIGVASIQALYKPISENDEDEINSILSATKIFYLKTGIYFIFLLVIVMTVYPKFIESNLGYYKISLLIFIMSLPTIFDYFIQGKLSVFITANQKAYVLNIIQIIATIISNIVRIVLIFMNCNILLVQLVFGIVSLLKIILIYLYIKKEYRWIDFNRKPNYKALEKRWSALVHQIAGLVVNGSSVIIISMFCGLEEASIYSLYNLIFSTITNFMWIFANSVTPSFGNLIVTESDNIIKDTYLKFESLFFMFVFIIYSTTYIMITPFIYLYTKNISDISYINKVLVVLFVIVNILNCIRIPANNMINATGEFSNTKKQAIIEAALNLFFSIIFVKKFGIYGVLIGGIISYMYRSIDIVLYTNKYIIKNTFCGTMKKIILNVILTIFLSYILNNFILNNTKTWIMLILNSIFIFLINTSIIISLNYIFDKEIIRSNLKRIYLIVSKGE
ncbi:oligosaccharide flippase family protein [Clostridium perfringens]|uniref:lipopolysaccharide biosynthesis protein n=1 Tax=Clostridium perfringens TaxID=1502 RepID=UPI0018E45157|nr:oligosaccharide flippase family protein [Clostridium perfringens]EIF2807766.1 oligosaccharide flippase family protein [Clostridium perfringens]ELC8310598.1 oligosaccharide flippase family protein [Clostridium perfringens]MBI6108109.1 oligosaccharide flippase family protein [Clostridium perfringens]MCO6002351.1 oligosaccharide flippase family protein [Clostridium perfringens]MCO7395097.1 oligosaccharide flippase family protein [Clostridium perfringens]